MSQKIFCVFNPSGRAPFYTHNSFESAKAEAKRLASLNPGANFYVMESVGMARKNDVSFYVHAEGHKMENQRADGDLVLEDEIPF